MRKYIYLGLCILVAIFLVGFVGPCVRNNFRLSCSHFKSNTVGLQRTAYWSDGYSTTKVWRFTSKVEYISGYARFIDDDGKTVSLGPGLCIEEQ